MRESLINLKNMPENYLKNIKFGICERCGKEFVICPQQKTTCPVCDGVPSCNEAARKNFKHFEE